MSRDWVDHQAYMGPCRRCGGSGTRVFDRRRRDAAGDAPPLHALLRRLRLYSTELVGEEKRLLVATYVDGAAALANHLHSHECGEVLAKAALLLRTAAAETDLEEPFDQAMSAALIQAQI